MAISKYPDATLPPGALGVVFEGYSSKGGITWTTRTVGAGTYMMSVNSYTDGTYTIHYPNNKIVQRLTETNPSLVNLTTSESSIITKVINRWATGIPNIFNGSQNGIQIMYQKPIAANNVAYLPIQMSTGVTATAIWKGAIAATTDGVTWTTAYTWTSGRPSLGIVHNGNGVYFTASGDSNTTLPSFPKVTTNFTNWADVTFSTGFSATNFNWIAGGGGNLLIAVDGLSLFVSTNGSNFNVVTLTAGSNIGAGGCVYNPVAGAFVTVGNPTTTNRNRVAYSTNGTTWTWQTIPSVASVTTGNQNGIAYGDGFFALAANNSSSDGFLIISSNGTTWTIAKTFATSDNGPDNVHFADGWFTVHSNGLNYTADFANWVTSVQTIGGVSYPTNQNTQLSGMISFNNVIAYTAASSGGITISSDQNYLQFNSMGSKQLN